MTIGYNFGYGQNGFKAFQMSTGNLGCSTFCLKKRTFLGERTFIIGDLEDPCTRDYSSNINSIIQWVSRW